MTRRPSSGWGLLFAAVVAVAGCERGLELAPVSGTVYYNDKPLEFGSVMLQPVSGGPPARGEIQPDGSFTLETYGQGRGAAVGTNQVRITCFESQRPGWAEAAGAEEEIPAGGSLIPRKYNSFGTSGLTLEVPRGGISGHEFRLTDNGD